MVGLDTLNMWMSAEKVGAVDLLDTVPRFLDRGTIMYQERHDGRRSVVGHIDNYRIAVYENGVSLKGSLAKSYLGSNVCSLDSDETALALESLSDRLFLPLEQATVRRFDLAHTFVMKYPVKAYLGYLGGSPRYNRLEQPKSVLWKNGKREKTVYDKGDECKRANSTLPNGFENKYLLRYELRHVSDLPKQFNMTELTPKHLCDKDFCRRVGNKWTEEYKDITKLQKMTFGTKPTSPNEFFDQLLMAGIESMGGRMAVENLVNEIRSNGGFTRPEHPSRIKRRLGELMRNPSLTVPSELLTELDEKVLAVG